MKTVYRSGSRPPFPSAGERRVERSGLEGDAPRSGGVRWVLGGCSVGARARALSCSVKALCEGTCRSVRDTPHVACSKVGFRGPRCPFGGLLGGAAATTLPRRALIHSHRVSGMSHIRTNEESLRGKPGINSRADSFYGMIVGMRRWVAATRLSWCAQLYRKHGVCRARVEMGHKVRRTVAKQFDVEHPRQAGHVWMIQNIGHKWSLVES